MARWLGARQGLVSLDHDSLQASFLVMRMLNTAARTFAGEGPRVGRLGAVLLLDLGHRLLLHALHVLLLPPPLDALRL
eukprot:3138471-Rhodomonas_salina.3